nr:hypothetical protein GCM10020093_031650 [Planobispora longispora]
MAARGFTALGVKLNEARTALERRREDLTGLVTLNLCDFLWHRPVKAQLETLVTARVADLAGWLGDHRGVVVAEVCDTLEKADLSDPAVFKHDADPERFAAAVLAEHPAGGDLDPRSRHGYEIVLHHVVAECIRAALQTPEFSGRALTEILSRVPAAPEADEDAHFTKRYLEYVENNDVVRNSEPEIRLSAVYIQPSVAMRQPAAPRGTIPALEEPATKSARLPLRQVLDANRRILLRGEAGIGKSTALDWLTLNGPDGQVPFLVRLSSCDPGKLPTPEQLAAAMVPGIADFQPRGWAFRRLRSGRSILLVDGVDEVPSAYHEQVRIWLRGLLAECFLTRVVVTTRPYAVSAGWLDGLDFVTADLQPLTRPEAADLARRWHAAPLRHRHEERSADPRWPLHGWSGTSISRNSSPPRSWSPRYAS